MGETSSYRGWRIYITTTHLHLHNPNGDYVKRFESMSRLRAYVRKAEKQAVT